MLLRDGGSASPRRRTVAINSFKLTGTYYGDINIVALSALLTTTMPNMKNTIEALKTAGLRDQVKVVIGGAPVTEAYARQIGADGYSADASRAVSLAKGLTAA